MQLSYGERQRLWAAVHDAIRDAEEQIHEAAHPKSEATAADRDAATDAAQAVGFRRERCPERSERPM